MPCLPNHFYLAIMSLFFFWSNPALASDTAIVIHGGAGTILKEKMSESVEADYRQALKLSVTTGHKILETGGTSTDAIIAAIKIMEDSPLLMQVAERLSITMERSNSMRRS